MESIQYINALDSLQSSCAKMILEADRLKHMYSTAGINQISDYDELGASVNSLADRIDELRKAINETCEQFYAYPTEVC